VGESAYFRYISSIFGGILLVKNVLIMGGIVSPYGGGYGKIGKSQ
jgi:hypothetical protein